MKLPVICVQAKDQFAVIYQKKKKIKANVISYGYKFMSCFGCDAKVVGSNLNFHMLHDKV